MIETLCEPSLQKRTWRYQQLCGHRTPDALFVLSAGITQQADGGYTPTTFYDTDPHGLLAGGDTRVKATALLARTFPEARIVTTSHSLGVPVSDAEVMKEALVVCGVSPERIQAEPQSISTLTELWEIAKLMRQNTWEHVAVVTNAYHLRRAKEMVKDLAKYAKKDGRDDQQQRVHNEVTTVIANLRGEDKRQAPQMVFVATEPVLTLSDQHYKPLIQVIYRSPAMQRRKMFEQKGICDYRAGVYRQSSV